MSLHTGGCCYKRRHQAVLQQSQTLPSCTHPTSWGQETPTRAVPSPAGLMGQLRPSMLIKHLQLDFQFIFSLPKKRAYLNLNKIWRHHSLRKPTNTHTCVLPFTHKAAKIKITAFSSGRSTTSQATAAMSSIHCSPSLCITQRNPAVFSVCKRASSLFSAAVTWFTKKRASQHHGD